MTGRVQTQRLSGAKLYLVLDAQVQPYRKLFDTMAAAVQAGVDVVQLRDKTGSARDIFGFVSDAVQALDGRVPFIVNDRLDIALAAGADGVHLGQEDLPLKRARQLAGPDVLIGLSCQTWEQARTAAEDGADYIGFGSVYRTQTKPGRSPMDPALLSRVADGISLPVFFIGGITAANLRAVCDLGVQRAAVTREILLAEDVSGKVRQLKALLLN